MVLAGAGSGKTKMLTSRIAYLIEACRVPAHQLLAVTFTNKAATEMRERVANYLSESRFLGVPEIGTFHAVCVRLLRRELAKTPFTKPFVIYDDSDQLSLLKDIVRKLNIDEKTFNPKALQGAINRAKCDAVEPHEMTPDPHNIFDKQLKRVYEQYQKELFANNALDFGEIICMAYRLLRDDAEVRARYQARFRYLHVDEYQDTNRAQYLFLNSLAGKESGGHMNICVVGDEDQSIYKWRGADISNILDFESDYPGASVVKLEQNYRSTKTIITAASQLIKNNRSRKDKTLWTENLQGQKIKHFRLPDERTEAEVVVAEIKRLAESDGKSFRDFSIFYRTHAQSRQFEDVLRREKIPYQIYGGLRFYDRKEIKDVLAYFKVILNTGDSVSLKRIINVPGRGIGKTTIDKIDRLHYEMQMIDAGASYWDALERAVREATLISAGTVKKLAGFVSLIKKLGEVAPSRLLTELYHLVLDETGYVRELKLEGTEEALARIENLEEFNSLLQEFEEEQEGAVREAKDVLLPMFLEQSSLATDVDQKDPHASVVNMMTLHSSKGLEFPVVFLVGMEEGLFPSLRAWEEPSDDEIEEERRLCYVGMTRAREYLYLLNVQVRRIWGNVNYQEPARFCSELPDELVDFHDLSYGSATSSFRLGSSRQFGFKTDKPAHEPTVAVLNRSSSPSFSSSSTQLDIIGQKLVHPEYGAGTIISREGSGNSQKVVVEFRGRERKKFLLSFLKNYF